jgi:ribosomal-protein-alanine N-acetyltransferase
MSAQLDTLCHYRRMTSSDLDAVAAIEATAYPYPWTRGNFGDSLEAGYHCWVVECAGVTSGYTVVMVTAGEAHLLNLTIDAPMQKRGVGRELLNFVLKLARDYGAQRMFLEVRPSNTAARALYAAAGFFEIALRRDYYPAGGGREDAIVLERSLN